MKCYCLNLNGELYYVMSTSISEAINLVIKIRNLDKKDITEFCISLTEEVEFFDGLLNEKVEIYQAETKDHKLILFGVNQDHLIDTAIKVSNAYDVVNISLYTESGFLIR